MDYYKKSGYCIDGEELQSEWEQLRSSIVPDDSKNDDWDGSESTDCDKTSKEDNYSLEHQRNFHDFDSSNVWSQVYPYEELPNTKNDVKVDYCQKNGVEICESQSSGEEYTSETIFPSLSNNNNIYMESLQTKLEEIIDNNKRKTSNLENKTHDHIENTGYPYTSSYDRAPILSDECFYNFNASKDQAEDEFDAFISSDSNKSINISLDPIKISPYKSKHIERIPFEKVHVKPILSAPDLREEEHKNQSKQEPLQNYPTPTKNISIENLSISKVFNNLQLKDLLEEGIQQEHNAVVSNKNNEKYIDNNMIFKLMDDNGSSERPIDFINTPLSVLLKTKNINETLHKDEGKNVYSRESKSRTENLFDFKEFDPLTRNVNDTGSMNQGHIPERSRSVVKENPKQYSMRMVKLKDPIVPQKVDSFLKNDQHSNKVVGSYLGTMENNMSTGLAYDIDMKKDIKTAYDTNVKIVKNPYELTSLSKNISDGLPPNLMDLGVLKLSTLNPKR